MNTTPTEAPSTVREAAQKAKDAVLALSDEHVALAFHGKPSRIVNAEKIAWDAIDALAALAAPTVPEVPKSSERAAFEAWIAKDCGDLSTFGTGRNRHYRNSAVNNAWTGWQAHAALPTVPAAEAPKPSRLLNFDRVAACLKILDSRPRPMCLDCADEDGICPSSGLNCDMSKLIEWATEPSSDTPRPVQPAEGETLFLVCAGGDGYQSEIVPESRLDDAYLLTQWGTLEDIDPEQRTAALEHFHDPDEWTYMDPLRGGKDRIAVEFSVNFEDGWVRVVRLPELRDAALKGEAP